MDAANDDHIRIVFLLYLNRSGSTLLAGLLDGYDEITVTPEANIPDGLLVKQSQISDDGDLESYLDTLYRDKKFRGWAIDRDILRDCLKKKGYPIGYNDILPVILGCFAIAGKKEKTCVFKRGHYIKHVPELRRMFPGCRFIFIERDIRAIYESQKRSLDSVTGKAMARNPVERALKYVRTIKTVKKYQNDEDFFVVSYERLVMSPDNTVSVILGFLGVGGGRSNGLPYYEKIPLSQRHLHQGVLRKPSRDKINAWQQELTVKEIYAIQFLAGKTLAERGYDLFKTDGTIQEIWYFCKALSDLLFRHSIMEIARRIKLLLNKH